MAGQDDVAHYRTDSDRAADFIGATGDPQVVRDAWETRRAETAFTDAYVWDADDLGSVGSGGDVLCEVLLHMVDDP